MKETVSLIARDRKRKFTLPQQINATGAALQGGIAQ
jgi:hypothetical protein